MNIFKLCAIALIFNASAAIASSPFIDKTQAQVAIADMKSYPLSADSVIREEREEEAEKVVSYSIGDNKHGYHCETRTNGAKDRRTNCSLFDYMLYGERQKFPKEASVKINQYLADRQAAQGKQNIAPSPFVSRNQAQVAIAEIKGYPLSADRVIKEEREEDADKIVSYSIGDKKRGYHCETRINGAKDRTTNCSLFDYMLYGERQKFPKEASVKINQCLADLHAGQGKQNKK